MASWTEAIQSALNPQSAVSQEIATLGWVMIVGAALIFLAVLALIAYALFGRDAERARLGGRRLIVLGGVAFPVVVLSALLVYALVSADRIVASDEPAAVHIDVVAVQFWWRVRYLDPAGSTIAVTANEIHIPAGSPADISVSSADVIHSFWVPNLAGKIDTIPGRINTLRLKTERLGVRRGQCAEYCGAQHARMAFHVVVETPEEFAAWLEKQGQPAAEPLDPFLRRGKSLFLAKDCGKKKCCADCHTIRGTPADEYDGPDLTHVGGRRWIAAGTFPANVGTLAGWIASARHLKPEAGMPSFDRYGGEDLRALAAYLESLK